MKKIFLPFLLVLFFASCVKNSSEYKKVQAENDSLLLLNAQTKADFDEMLLTLNEVEDGFNQIKAAENYLTIQSQTQGEVSTSTRERLKSDMHLVAETLKSNKERLSKLESQLKNSNYQSAALKKTIERLNSEIGSKTLMISNLQEELAKRDIKIQELDDAVAELGGKVNNLTHETAQQKSELRAQTKELNTVWYVYGTKDELKKQNIVSGGGLFKSVEVMKDEFNKEYFIKDDLRKLKEIPLYAKKAKILSNQPDGSYKYIKDENKNLTLVIENPEEFWSVSKYLVIMVD